MMSRSKWKGPNQKTTFWKKGFVKSFRSFNRSVTILPSDIGRTVKIYNGQKFHTLKVQYQHIGYRFGEFVFSRKKYKYKK